MPVISLIIQTAAGTFECSVCNDDIILCFQIQIKLAWTMRLHTT